MPEIHCDCTKPDANRGEAFSLITQEIRRLRGKQLQFTVTTERKSEGGTRMIIETTGKTVGFDAKKERAAAAAKAKAQRDAAAKAEREAAEKAAKQNDNKKTS
jgi:HJR/Mrr/RecB family endonuclease